MTALSMAALKRQLATLADEYSGLSPQVAAEIAADALEAIEAAEAKLDRISVMACDDDAGAWNAHQPLIVAITAVHS